MTNSQLAEQFFLQIAVILLVCRLVGMVARWFGQPQVVAEMIAGVCLGPSLLGLFFPELQSAIFPWDRTTRDSQSYIFPVSQLGLALYMFTVGMDFRLDIVRSRWTSSLAVSLAGMLSPFVLGAGLGLYFHSATDLFPPGNSAWASATFLGASMCITAFPMLARIIRYKGLNGTRMGTVAIGAGAIDDACAWCLLALVLSSIEGSPQTAIKSIGGGLVFVLAIACLLRPLLLKMQRWLTRADDEVSEAGLVICLVLMALGALATDKLGLHAVFGSFLVGTAIPRGTVVRGVTERVEPLTVALLLPMFFTFSGLNTQIGLLNTSQSWLLCLLVLIVAMVGKGVSCWLAGLATGIPNREALGIGVLMNARGLMELIIINIGRERGLISNQLFAMLVIMAIVTTLMASPLFDRLTGSVISPQTD
ncbi:MAG: cation:proton antiporter [Planctomycetaceae bacterium]|jgi:Kef-type K+ transport system membrane component KefB